MAHSVKFTVGPRTIEVEEDCEWGEDPTGEWRIGDTKWMDPWYEREWAVNKIIRRGGYDNSVRPHISRKSIRFDDTLVNYLSWIDGV